MLFDRGMDRHLRAWKNSVEYVNFSPDEVLDLMEKLKREYPGKCGRLFRFEIQFNVRKESGWDLATLVLHNMGEEGEWDDFYADLQSKNFLLEEKIDFYNMEYYRIFFEERLMNAIMGVLKESEWAEKDSF